jgi:hypothetical protein
MKKRILAAIVAASTAATAIPAQAEDACKVVFCMFGLVQGQNDSTCRDAIASYFSIVAFRHGHPDLSATPKNRLSFTQSCPSAPGNITNMISQTFGTTIR